jgi:biopolymer transport protein ExbB/TolQ
LAGGHDARHTTEDFGMNNRAARVGLVISLLAGSMAVATSVPAKPVAEPTYGQPTPEAARAKLNREQAQEAREQLAENAASRSASEAAALAREDQIRSDQAAWEAEKARLASEHAAAMEQWRADVTACRNGDRTRCRH